MAKERGGFSPQNLRRLCGTDSDDTSQDRFGEGESLVISGGYALRDWAMRFLAEHLGEKFFRSHTRLELAHWQPSLAIAR